MSDLVGNPEDRCSQDMAKLFFHVTENYLFETKISKVELLKVVIVWYIRSSSDLSKTLQLFFQHFSANILPQ